MFHGTNMTNADGILAEGSRGSESRGQGGGAVPQFGDLDKAILGIESTFYRFEGAKHEAIREQTGLSPTGYYQRLNQIIDTPEALEHDPVTVRRLLNKRQAHRDMSNNRPPR